PAPSGSQGRCSPLSMSRSPNNSSRNGFRKVVLMGDHGGGQKGLGEVAKKLDEKYSSQGIRVVYCDDVYQKFNADFDHWLATNGYPPSSHAGIRDTSEMLYLGGD